MNRFRRALLAYVAVNLRLGLLDVALNNNCVINKVLLRDVPLFGLRCRGASCCKVLMLTMLTRTSSRTGSACALGSLNFGPRLYGETDRSYPGNPVRHGAHLEVRLPQV